MYIIVYIYIDIHIANKYVQLYYAYIHARNIPSRRKAPFDYFPYIIRHRKHRIIPSQSITKHHLPH